MTFNKHSERMSARVTVSFLIIHFIFLYLLAPSAFASSPTVDDIKYWSNPNYTRVVISLSKESAFTSRLLKKDPSINVGWRRLLIDIKDARLARSLERSIPINDGLLKTARAGQFDSDTVRVVLDIDSIEDFKVFPLSDPYRIVIDVTGDKPADQGKAAEEVREPAASQPLGRIAPGRIKKIVLDPGHGGHDPGAIGKGGLKEKDVTLKLGRLLREKLHAKLGSKIIMTRDTDVFIPLEERTAIANREDADLFVSIHINSSLRRAASGVETYMLNLSRDEESRRLAARENATSRKAVSDLEFILNDLIKTAKTNDSVRLASMVQDNLVKKLNERYGGVRGNGVKGAPFYVLVGTRMPSILVEVSFISNPLEEKRLQDDKYLHEVVDGIAAGLISYIGGAGSI
ncbi:MAG: N-acetylmuramoyl-L-alanine amidase [Deltaproteobacteria bacterium]|nr:N-acetylmuramoyl-L-alanine amidase [Deltaproteobacteria bacterium]